MQNSFSVTKFFLPLSGNKYNNRQKNKNGNRSHFIFRFFPLTKEFFFSILFVLNVLVDFFAFVSFFMNFALKIPMNSYFLIQLIVLWEDTTHF